MARGRIITILGAVALGVHAGPCNPPHYSSKSSYSTGTLVTDVVTHSTASLTTTTDITATVGPTSTSATETSSTNPTTESSSTLEASSTDSSTSTSLTTVVTESTSATSSTLETASTDSSTSTSLTTVVTESASATSSDSEAPTPTPDEPPCIPTQILANPSFDDNDDVEPWVLGAGVSVSQVNPRSEPNFLYNTFNRGGDTTVSFSQRLPALGASTYQLQYYIDLQTAINGRDFSCVAVPSIGDQTLLPSRTLGQTGPYGFQLSSQTFESEIQDLPVTLTVKVTCTGSYSVVIIGADDFSLVRLCGQ